MTLEPFIPLIRGMIDLVAGYFVARFASKAAHMLVQRQRKPRYELLIKKTIFYVIFVLFILSAAREWGLNINIILGATGIFTVMLSLASQTVVSNLVSGLFLLGEDSLRIGDIIRINDIEGKIISVNLFSLKLIQEDNIIVRIPNDLLLKTPVINLSRLKD